MSDGMAGVPRPNAPSTAQDIMKQPKTPQGLARALLAAIVDSSDDAIASKDLDGLVTSWNRAAERLFGYTAGEMIGRPIAILAAPGRENEMSTILERIRCGERVDHYETVRRRKDGSLVEISLTVSPVRDHHGHIIGASKIARDISGRRQLEEERELRVRELRHRVKNLLTIIGAIANQTAVEGLSAQDYRNDFMGRLSALAAAHEIAFQTEAGADLSRLLTRLLDPYVHRAWGNVVTIEGGPAVSIPQRKIQSLAFVLHELATNAVKHGALSVPKGRLRISWHCHPRTWLCDGGDRSVPSAARERGEDAGRRAPAPHCRGLFCVLKRRPHN